MRPFHAHFWRIILFLAVVLAAAAIASSARAAGGGHGGGHGGGMGGFHGGGSFHGGSGFHGGSSQPISPARGEGAAHDRRSRPDLWRLEGNRQQSAQRPDASGVKSDTG